MENLQNGAGKVWQVWTERLQPLRYKALRGAIPTLKGVDKVWIEGKGVDRPYLRVNVRTF